MLATQFIWILVLGSDNSTAVARFMGSQTLIPPAQSNGNRASKFDNVALSNIETAAGPQVVVPASSAAGTAAAAAVVINRDSTQTVEGEISMKARALYAYQGMLDRDSQLLVAF